MAPQRTSRSGKVYYTQRDPAERGFPSTTLRLREGEMEEFKTDAKDHGGISAYIRKLWAADRQKRGLEPWKPAPDKGEPS